MNSRRFKTSFTGTGEEKKRTRGYMGSIPAESFTPRNLRSLYVVNDDVYSRSIGNSPSEPVSVRAHRRVIDAPLGKGCPGVMSSESVEPVSVRPAVYAGNVREPS